MCFEKNCVHCGHKLSISEWDPNRICPSCGKCTVKVEIREVHVLCGDRDADALSHFLSDEAMDSVLQRNGRKVSVGIDYHFVRLCYELCVGKISDPPYSNASIYAHFGDSPEAALARAEYQLQKLEGVDGAVPIYLWVSDDDVNGFLNLLYFSDVFARFERVFLVRWVHTEKTFDGSKRSMRNALERKTELSVQAWKALSARFAEIRGWNAECLVGTAETVEPWSFGRLEEYVFAAMTDEYRTAGRIWSEVSAAVYKETSFSIGLRMTDEAIHRLMMTGRVESHGACMWWGDSHHNNMLCTQTFRRAKGRPKKIPFRMVAGVLRDAFELGYTYPLYGLLDGDSVLSSGGRETVGAWDVIGLIESEGSYRVNSRKAQVTCRVIGEQGGGRSQTGEIFLLVSYEIGESEEHRLVSVFVENGVIRRMELSEPERGEDVDPIEEESEEEIEGENGEA